MNKKYLIFYRTERNIQLIILLTTITMIRIMMLAYTHIFAKKTDHLSSM